MKRIYQVLIWFCLLTVSCSEEDFDLDNLSNNNVFVIGNGGAGFISTTNNIPENSMKSIELAIEGYNAHGVEVDVQLSKDSQLVLYHDDDLFTKTSCKRGGIHQYNWDEIKDCTYSKNHFGSVFVDEKLILLERALSKFSKRREPPQIHLDIRQNNFDEEAMSRAQFYDLFSRKIVQLIEKYQAEDWVFCGSQDTDMLQAIRQKNTQIRLFLEGDNVGEMIEAKKKLD